MLEDPEVSIELSGQESCPRDLAGAMRLRVKGFRVKHLGVRSCKMQSVGSSAAWFSNDSGVIAESPASRAETNSEDCLAQDQRFCSPIGDTCGCYNPATIKTKDPEVGECWPLVLHTCVAYCAGKPPCIDQRSTPTAMNSRIRSSHVASLHEQA